MVTIGERRVIFSSAFLVLENESVTIKESYSNETIKIKLSFTTKDVDEGDKKAVSISVEGKEDYADVIFTNWNRLWGMSTDKTIKIGYLERTNELVTFLSYISYEEGVYNVQFQLMVEDVKK